MNLFRALLIVLLINLIRADWWEAGSYYQIYPRSFKDSDGDGIGDLRGIADKLDYLKELGITATWLSPIYKSPLIDYGYDISDFYSIGPEYGTMSDFEYLMAKSKATGVKVLMDFVPNHSSDQNEWFVKSVNGEEPYKDFYIWHPGKVDPTNSSLRVPPSNWQAIGYAPGSAWTWNDKRQAFYYHQFAIQQPDLNFRNPKVHEEMRNVLKFWLDKGVAGFRVDAITHMYETAPDADNNLPDEPLSGNSNDSTSYEYLHHIHSTDQNETFDLVYEWREFLDDYAKTNGGDTKILMTESYSNITTVQRYYTNGVRQGAQLPFNFELMKQIHAGETANDMVRAVHSWLDPMPKGYYSNWVFGNHDGSRMPTRMGKERLDLYSALVLLLPGTSVTYYGEEIGMTDVCIAIDSQTKEYSRCDDFDANPFVREFVRTPFQWDSSANGGFTNGTKTWLPLAEDYKQVNYAIQNGQKGSHVEIYKKLMALRQTEAGANGTLVIQALSDDILMIKRVLNDSAKESLVAIFNFGHQYTNLAETSESESSVNIKVHLSRLNSFHDVGSIVGMKNIRLAPYDLLVGTSSSYKISISFIVLLVSLMFHL